MAISALEYGGDQEQSKVLAEQIKLVGIEEGLSTLGEMFHADKLAESIRIAGITDLQVKTAIFHSEYKLNGLLETAAKRGVDVLVPYFSKNAVPFAPHAALRRVGTPC